VASNVGSFQRQGLFKGPEEVTSNVDKSFALAPKPIKVHVLVKWLNNYNQSEANLVLPGFTFGFRLNYEAERYSQISMNLKAVHLL